VFTGLSPATHRQCTACAQGRGPEPPPKGLETAQGTLKSMLNDRGQAPL